VQPAEHVSVELMLTALPAPLKPVATLPYASFAVTWIAKLEPAVCVLIVPPPFCSTRKPLTPAGATVRERPEFEIEPSLTTIDAVSAL